MTVVAWILVALLSIEYLRTFFGPLITLYSSKKDSKSRAKRGLHVLFSWVGPICGAMVVGWVLRQIGGPERVLEYTALNILAVASWITLIGGLAIVITAFVQKPQMAPHS